jgi:hypothetical protein
MNDITGTYAAANGEFVTITAAYGWNGLFDVVWVKPGVGQTGSGRLSHVEVAAIVRRCRKV